MKTGHTIWCICIAIYSNMVLSALAWAHGDGSSSGGKNLIAIPLVANPDIPEFAAASGTVEVNLSRGIFRLKNLKGFPLHPQRKVPLVNDITSLTDPRLKDRRGALRQTSCHPLDRHLSVDTISERSHKDDDGENGDHHTGPWTCHVHSYVVWLVSLHDRVLGHSVIPLGTIYPRSDGTAADREFSTREGDMSGLFSTAIIITAEITFGPLPSIVIGHHGAPTIQVVPLGPIVLQATLP